MYFYSAVVVVVDILPPSQHDNKNNTRTKHAGTRKERRKKGFYYLFLTSAPRRRGTRRAGGTALTLTLTRRARPYVGCDAVVGTREIYISLAFDDRGGLHPAYSGGNNFFSPCKHSLFDYWGGFFFSIL